MSLTLLVCRWNVDWASGWIDTWFGCEDITIKRTVCVGWSCPYYLFVLIINITYMLKYLKVSNKKVTCQVGLSPWFIFKEKHINLQWNPRNPFCWHANGNSRNRFSFVLHSITYPLRRHKNSNNQFKKAQELYQVRINT